jgi:hypothetical protein
MSKYTREDEHYRFQRLYSIDLDMVEHDLALLRRYRRQDIRYCILRDIVVTYARPFSANRGEHFRNHSLRESFVPAESRQLHAWLISLRNQLLAHTDYSHHKPTVGRWPMGSRYAYPMSFRVPDYARLERETDNIRELVSKVVTALNADLRRIEAESETNL